MYRQQQPSISTPPQTLRRRQHVHSTETVPLSLSSSTQTSPRRQGWNQTLDISICQPANPFSNRFAVLATPEEPMPLRNPSFPSFPVPNPNRTRTRASRGTKEAKKRRDLRRNRRKLAAQMFDAQLAQTFDETLTRANIPPSPLARAAYLPEPPSPVQELPERLVAYGTRNPPLAPPEVPMPEFDHFDIGSIPRLLPTNRVSEVHVTEPFGIALPPWCPPIRSLTMHDVWRECLPTFFDLSSLPEPTAEASAAPGTRHCRDLQLWRPQMVTERKQSRFFPSTPKDDGSKRGEENVFGEPRVKVKLPPIRTRLHSSDTGLRRSPSTLNALMIPKVDHEIHLTHAKPNRKRPLQTREDHSTGPELHVQPYYQEKEAIALPTTVSDPAEEVSDEATAANLWRILHSSPGSGTSGTPALILADSIASNVPYLPDPYEPDYGKLVYPSGSAAQECITTPQELDGRELPLPYVHANSLTGFSNKTESTLVDPEYENWPFLETVPGSRDDLRVEHQPDEEELGPDYATRPSPQAAPGDALPSVRPSDDLICFNEMLVDHDIFAATSIPLPPTPPRTPILADDPDLPRVLPIDSIDEDKAGSNASDGAERVPEDEDEESDAHFRSEQTLFQRSSGRRDRTSSSSGSLIDVEAFLKMGHARNCWCGRCDENSGLDDDSAVSLCLDTKARAQLPEGETAVSDAATTASNQVDDGDGDSDDDEWLVYSSDFGTPSCGVRRSGLCTSDEQARLEDVCLERRSSEWELEWEWDPEF